MPSRTPAGAGSQPAKDAGTERTCSVKSSAPSGSAARTVFSFPASATGIDSPSLPKSSVPHAAAFDRQRHRLPHFECQNPPQFLVRLNQQKMIGKPQFGPVTQPGAHRRQRNFEFARRAENISDKLFEREGGRESALRFTATNVNATSMAKLHPPLPLELPIAAANRIGMEMKPPGKFARARQPLACGQIVAQNSQNDLRDQLFAQRYSAVMCKPELHGSRILVRPAIGDNADRRASVTSALPLSAAATHPKPSPVLAVIQRSAASASQQFHRVGVTRDRSSIAPPAKPLNRRRTLRWGRDGERRWNPSDG